MNNSELQLREFFAKYNQLGKEVLGIFQAADPLLWRLDEESSSSADYLDHVEQFIEGLRPVAWALFAPNPDTTTAVVTELVRRSFSVQEVVDGWWLLEEPVREIVEAIIPAAQRLCPLGRVG